MTFSWKVSIFLIVLAIAISTQTTLVYAQTTPLFTFGSYGSGSGQLNTPGGIAIDNAGNIYVADYNNHRIEKFNSAGAFLSSITISGSPAGIALDSSDNIYVTDPVNEQVEKFNSAGAFLSSFGSAGNQDGQFGGVSRIALDSNGNIYVTDAILGKIQKFNSQGIFLSSCCTGGMPEGMAIDSSGNIYIANMSHMRLDIFNSTGIFLSSFGSSILHSTQTGSPQDVALDSFGNIYVADTDHSLIIKFNSTGSYMSSINISGTPVGIAINSNKIYVTDLGNNRVDVYSTSQFDNNTVNNAPEYKMINLNENSTALSFATNLATGSPQFQSLVQGYNYSFNTDFYQTGPVPQGGVGLTSYGLAFELYKGPVVPGQAIKTVEVFLDPTLTKILDVTSNGVSVMGSASSSSPPVSIAGNAMQLSDNTGINSGDTVQAVEQLVGQGLVKLPNSSGSSTNPASIQMPSWIKNTMTMLKNGDISEDEFTKEIQYLIDNEIIKINVSTGMIHENETQ